MTYELRQPCLLDGRPGMIAGVVYGHPAGSRYDVLLVSGEVVANANANRLRPRMEVVSERAG